MSDWIEAEPITSGEWKEAAPVEQVPTEKKVVKKPSTFLEGALGAGETALNLGTAIPAMTIAPIAQIITHMKTGSYDKGREVADATRDLLTYQPKTEYGKWGSEKLLGPILSAPAIPGQILEEDPNISQQFGKELPFGLNVPAQHIASRLQEAGEIPRDIINTTGIGKTIGDVLQFGLEVAGYKPTHTGISKVASIPKEVYNRRRIKAPVEEVQPIAKPSVEAGETLTTKIEPNTTAQVNRRNRQLIKDIEEKKADTIQLSEMLKKEKEDAASDNMVIEEPKVEVVDEATKAFIQKVVQEKGNAQSVRELYKTDSPVDVYAREYAQQIYPTEKLPLSEKEFKQLEDTGVFIPEELEALRKEPADKQREQYDRMFEPPIKYTSEELAKAIEISKKVEENAKVQLSKSKDIITLRENEWSDDAISKMSADEIARKASVLRGEVNPINPTKDTIDNLTNAEIELDAFRKEIGDKPLTELTLEEEARYFDLMNRFSDELGLDTSDIVLKNLETIKEPVVSRREVIAEKAKAMMAKRGKVSKWQDAEPIKKEMSFKDYEEILKEEGMPEELEFSENDYKNMNSFERLQADNEIPMTNREASEAAWKRVNDKLKDFTSRRRSLNSNTEARNLLVDVDKYMPRTEAEAIRWLKTCKEVELLVEGKIEHKQSAFSRKSISDALSRGEISKEQHKYANDILNSIKVQPTFGLEKHVSVGAYRSGVYSLANNFIKVSDVNILAHEITHFGYDNILTAADRMAWREIFISTYYKNGKLNMTKLRLDTTNPVNAVINPAETFACKGLDFAHSKVLTPTELNLFQKIKTWYTDLKDKLIRRGGRDVSKFEEVDRLFEKIFDKEKRRGWTENEKEPVFIEDALGYDTAFNENKVWHGTKDFFDKYLGRFNSNNLPTITNNKITLNKLGLNNVTKRVSELGNIFRKAKVDDQGRRILGEIKGYDWGLATELKGQTLFSTDNTTVKERLYRNLGPWISSPMKFAEGTRNERHVYNTNLAEMFISHMYDQHRTTIDAIEHTLKKGNGNHENVRKVIEGKIEGTEAERVAAGQVREWLDAMKARYKLYSINEFKANLNKTEYNALLDLVSGTDTESVKAKYPKLSTEVIEEIATKFKEIDTWGIDNYIPNVEAGRFKLIVDATTKDGVAYKKLVAIGLSEKDAIRKGTKYLGENPDVKQLYVDTDYKMISDDKTSITRGQYYGMMNSLSKKMLESIDGIDKGIAKEMARKTLQRKFKIVPTDSYSPFLEARQDILKGEENIFPVLRSYAHSMEKKMALDPVIDIIRKDIPKMNKYEKAYILDYIEDVKGKYSKADKMVDDIFRTYRGYSRLISRTRTTEAILKLGYRPVAAAVNLASGQMHTWVKRGAPIYAEGIKFLNTPEGKKFIQDVEPFLGTSIIESGVEIKSKTPKWHPLGMFQMPEPLNREVSVASAYKQAIKPVEEGGFGMSELAAKEFAIRANWAEQFTYNMANLPKIMRGPTGKLITQFKPYLVKEIEFMSTLSGKEWLRYASMQLTLGGPRGYLMIMKSLPILATFGFWQEASDSIEEWMNKNAPLASRGIAGAPGLIKPEYAGDISAAATFQFPSYPMDFLGPALSDLINLKKKVLDPLTTTGPYADDLEKTGDIAPIVRHWKRLMQYTFSDDNWLRKENGVDTLYKVEDAVPFIIQSILGIESAEINRLKATDRIKANRDKREDNIKTRIINEAVQLHIDGKPIPEELRLEMIKNGVTVESLLNRVKQSHLTPRQRAIINTEIRRRRDAIEMFPIEEDYIQNSQEE